MGLKEFCHQLVSIREQKGVGKNEMCRRMGITFNYLQRLESGEFSFALSKALAFLDLLGKRIRVTNSSDSYTLTGGDKLATIVGNIRKELNLSFDALAKLAAMSQTTIMKMEKNQSDTGIVLILQFFEQLHFEVSIDNKH